MKGVIFWCKDFSAQSDFWCEVNMKATEFWCTILTCRPACSRHTSSPHPAMNEQDLQHKALGEYIMNLIKGEVQKIIESYIEAKENQVRW